MHFSTQINTVIGTIQLCCDEHGLSKIILPNESLTSQEENAWETKRIPAVLDLATQQIHEYFDGKRIIFEIPLSLHGTDFQQQVWNIIHRIPYGQTMSYGEIAKKLGGIGKARAVGGAANANPLPLIIPCHRVIGTNGTLTGFAGGIELKKSLLDMEKKI